jgi:hypothetical protein
VYNPSGGLLGSWSAGGLPKNATVEGIATNGADIWILANSTSKDEVFKYTGAASRLSGSQSAASSFGLNGADANPKGLVTDGTSLWVVDDGGTADKVFKYSLSGSLLGSWAIDPANTHPTGLTINPSNVSDVWVVDSGTARVYQYTAAASRISGSQTAAATFALAAGNTNPQDIADPPPPDMLLTRAPAPLALNQPSAAAINGVSSSGPAAAGGGRPPASRDALFALLGGESIPLPGAPSLHLAAHLGDGARTPGGPYLLDDLASLLAGGTQRLRSEGSAADPLAWRLRKGAAWIDDGPASAAADDPSAPPAE